jgi:hypothetical protein
MSREKDLDGVLELHRLLKEVSEAQSSLADNSYRYRRWFLGSTLAFTLTIWKQEAYEAAEEEWGVCCLRGKLQLALT